MTASDGNRDSIVQRAAIIGSAIFLVIAPGTLAVYVPWYLTHWHFAPALFPIACVLGAALIARSCGPDSSCSLSPTKSLRWASSSPTSTSATARM